MAEQNFKYISFGAGVQSTAVLAMSTLGLRGCPRAEVAIFADTGDEPQWVYDIFEQVKKLTDIPVESVTFGKLSDCIISIDGGRKRFLTIPAFTLGKDGKAVPLRRQCTREYKIQPIEKRIRELLGYKPRQRIKKRATAMIGISLDEITRVRDSRTHWVDNYYPLIDARMNRHDCLRLLEEIGWPKPGKSSCVFCPFHSDSFWRELKNKHPEEFAKACEFDETIRDATKTGLEGTVYLHRSLKPLAEIDFDAKNANQPDLFVYECEGLCGV